MAAEIVSPTDELTGMPLALAPRLEPLPDNEPAIANWHHWWHPRTAPELQTLGGKALRHSRVQLVPVGDHNIGTATYHHYYEGPPLPGANDTDAQFRLCVLSAAGYIPHNVIDLHAEGVPTVRRMTDAERAAFNATPRPQIVSPRDIEWYKKKLLETGSLEMPHDDEIRMILSESFSRQALFSRHYFRYAYEPLRDFLEAHLISAPRLDVSSRFMRRFLGARDEGRRIEMGETILMRASVVSTAGLMRVYRQLHDDGMLHPHMPAVPIELVRDKLGSASRRQQLIPRIAACLEELVENVPQAA